MISSSFHSTTNTFIAEETAPEQVPAEGREDEALHPTSIDYAYTPPLPLTEESQKKVDDLFEKILWLDMIEVHLLTQVVNEQLGIAWNQVDYSGGPIAVAGGGATQEEVVEEKLLKDLKLLGFDAKAKIKVIKEVRSIAGLGLKEAKEMVESAPKIIQKDLKPEKAGELKAQLEAVGAQIEIA
jgi:large subunit ribosomal protein L7/L12